MSTTVATPQEGKKKLRKVKRAIEQQQGVGPGRLDDTAALAQAPNTIPGQENSQMVNAAGNYKSAFGMAPMRWTNVDPRDEDMRTLRALEASGLLGQDKIAGQRNYTPAVADYYQGKLFRRTNRL